MRKARRLTLRQVADLSRRFAKDRTGHISSAYLTQIERGRKTSVGVSKLATLSVIYRRPLSYIVSLAPSELRDAKWHELEALRAEMARFPGPWEDVEPKKTQADKKHYAMLAERARDSVIPIGRESEAFVTILFVMEALCLPAYLEGDGGDAAGEYADQFDAAAFDWIGEPHAHDSEGYWPEVARDLCRFARYRRQGESEVFDGVDWWSIDFDGELVSCHFIDRRLDSRFGLDGTPILVAERFRLIQAAGMIEPLLRERGGARLLPVPNEIEEGIDTYLGMLQGMYRPIGTMPRSPNVWSLCAAANDIRTRIPPLRPAALDESAHDAVIRLLGGSS